MVEVTGAVKRNTRSESFAKEVKTKMNNIPNIYFVDLDKDRAESSSNLAAEYN